MFTSKFLRFDTIGSTNAEAIREAQLGAPEGTCLLAREQTAGRGRQDRTWVSARDAGLFLSVILRPQLPLDQWPALTLMTAVALHETLAVTYGLKSDIKWPNDVLIADRKLAGILAETVDTPAGRAAVIGIGVNLRRAAVPPELTLVATSLETETPIRADLSAGELAHALVLELARWYDTLQQPDGLSAVIHAWSSRSSFAFDKAVAIVTGNESFIGITQGLTELGALRVRTESGELRILHSAEITALRSHDHK